MNCFINTVIWKCTTRNFSGREVFVELGHFNKYFVKNAWDKRWLRGKVWCFASYILSKLHFKWKILSKEEQNWGIAPLNKSIFFPKKGWGGLSPPRLISNMIWSHDINPPIVGKELLYSHDVSGKVQSICNKSWRNH